MQNLPAGLVQNGRDLYDRVEEEGSARYAKLYFAGLDDESEVTGQEAEIPDDLDPDEHPGIPADDINVFASMVYAFADKKHVFDAVRASGKKVRQVDCGTGTSPYSFIAGMVHADECITIDYTQTNVDYFSNIKSGKKPIPFFWHSWKEIGAILHDLGSAENLMILSTRHMELYDTLRKWPLLDEATKATARSEIYAALGVTPSDDNPYTNIDLQQAVATKLKPRQGDLLDKVEQFAELEGTADICTSVFWSESIDDKLAIAAHAEVNAVQFLKPATKEKEGGLRVSAHISETTGYEGYFTPEQKAANPGVFMPETPATAKVFHLLGNELIVPITKYEALWKGLDSKHGDQLMQRDLEYGKAVVVCGTADYLKEDGELKCNHGLDLLARVRSKLRYTKHELNYTVGEELDAAMNALDYAYKLLNNIYNGQMGKDVPDWDKESKEFWGRCAKIVYKRPQEEDVKRLLSIVLDVKEAAKREDSTFIEIDADSAPQGALAALAGGMKNIIISGRGKGAVEWLEGELLGDEPFSGQTEMWWDIVNLLGYFNSKEDFSNFCSNNRDFMQKLHHWDDLEDPQKKACFDQCFRHMRSQDGGSFHTQYLYSSDPTPPTHPYAHSDWYTTSRPNFITSDIHSPDPKVELRKMASEGKFEIRKLSPFDLPEDLIGKGDVVTASYAHDSVTEVPSEYCKSIVTTCQLARPETGRVNLAFIPYANWDLYNPTQPLPGFMRHYLYHHTAMSTASEQQLEPHSSRSPKTNFGDLLDKETSMLRKWVPGAIGTSPDSRQEYPLYSSFYPKTDLDSVEMLRFLSVGLLNNASTIIRNEILDTDKKSLQQVQVLWQDLRKELVQAIEQHSADHPQTEGRLKERITAVIESLKEEKSHALTHKKGLEEAIDTTTKRFHYLTSHIRTEHGDTDLENLLNRVDTHLFKFMDAVYQIGYGRDEEKAMDLHTAGGGNAARLRASVVR